MLRTLLDAKDMKRTFAWPMQLPGRSTGGLRPRPTVGNKEDPALQDCYCTSGPLIRPEGIASAIRIEAVRPASMSACLAVLPEVDATRPCCLQTPPSDLQQCYIRCAAPSSAPLLRLAVQANLPSLPIHPDRFYNSAIDNESSAPAILRGFPS